MHRERLMKTCDGLAGGRNRVCAAVLTLVAFHS